MLQIGRLLVLAALVAVGVSACGNAGKDRVLSIDAVGLVEGVVFLDVDGSGDLGGGDTPMVGVRVGLVPLGAVDTAFATTSNAQGEFELVAVPVGSYLFVVDTSSVGDTVTVVRNRTVGLTLVPDEVDFVTVLVSFPRVSIAAARSEIPGRRLFVEGIATTALGVFGDSSLHAVDTSGAIRALRVQRATILAGDSVRLLGTVGNRNGQPVLENVAVTLISITTTVPPPEDVTTTTAAFADAARLDAALVRVQNAAIADTTTVGIDVSLTVDDGTGPLQVWLDGDLLLDPAPYVPGVVISAIGVLVPTGGGTWQLKPRGAQDLTIN